MPDRAEQTSVPSRVAIFLVTVIKRITGGCPRFLFIGSAFLAFALAGMASEVAAQPDNSAAMAMRAVKGSLKGCGVFGPASSGDAGVTDRKALFGHVQLPCKGLSGGWKGDLEALCKSMAQHPGWRGHLNWLGQRPVCYLTAPGGVQRTVTPPLYAACARSFETLTGKKLFSESRQQGYLGTSNSFLAFRWKDRHLHCFLVQKSKDDCEWLYSRSDPKYRQKARGGESSYLKEREALTERIDRLEEAIMPENLSVGHLAEESNYRINQIRKVLQDVEESLSNIEASGEWYENELEEIREKFGKPGGLEKYKEKVGRKLLVMTAIRALAKEAGPAASVAGYILDAVEADAIKGIKYDLNQHLREHFKSNREAAAALYELRTALTTDLGREINRHDRLEELIPLSYRWTLAWERKMSFAAWRELELRCLAKRYGK